MNFESTILFTPKAFERTAFKICKPTIGIRMQIMKLMSESGTELSDLKAAEIMWNTLVADFEGVTIDGVKPSVSDLFLNGDEVLVGEVVGELRRLTQRLSPSDDGDLEIIASAERQIAEARGRIELRKNSEAQSTSPTSPSEEQIAGSASSTSASANSGTVTAG